MKCRMCGGETHSLKSICYGCEKAELYRHNPNLKDMEQMAISWENRLKRVRKNEKTN